jgi:integrase
MSRRKGKRWQGKVDSRDASGKYHAQTQVFDTEREANRWEAKIKSQLADGKLPPSGITVGEMLEEWYLHESPTWRSSTQRNYRSIIDKRLIPKWGKVPIKKVQVKMVESWYRELRDTPSSREHKNLSPGSIHKYHSVARLAFNFAVRWEYISDNPFAKAKSPTPVRAQIVPPSIAEVQRITERAMDIDTHIGTALYLSAVTGARRGEVMGLQWGDIDFDTGNMRIKNSVSFDLKDKIEVNLPKNNYPRRNKFGVTTLELLTEHKKVCEEIAKTVKATLTDESYLFSLNPDFSTPMRPDYFYKRFKKIAVECGVPKMRLHDLRHYNASRMFEQGADLITVAGRLGHRDARTTLAVYAHFLETPDGKAAEKIEQDFIR